MKKINVLSLFDGIAGAYVALKRAGFEINKYYSSEIDKYAMGIANFNNPDIVQLGDIDNWKNWNIEWNNIDLLIGGSPCQNLSQAGNGAGLNGEKSKLFFTFIYIKNHLMSTNKNAYFLLENVKTPKKWQNIMTQHNVLKDWGCVRKFHPVEVERLQTFPDGYTEYYFKNHKLLNTSNTQRLKTLGNSFTVDVIAHILAYLRKDLK